MRKVLRVAAFAAVGLALLSCARRAEQQVAAPPPAAYDQAGAPDDGAGYDDGRGQSLAAPYGRSDYAGNGVAPPPPPYDRSTYDAAEPEPPASPYARPSYATSRPSPTLPYGRPSYGQGVPPPSYGRPSYARAPQVITPPVYGRTLPPAYGRPAYAEAAPPTPSNGMVWRSSPRWATVKKPPTAITRPAPQKSASTASRAKPKPDPQAKFKAAQAKAAKVGVENLTQEDIAGLTPDEIKQLRGY
jgi:hypothetical protein